MLFIALSLAPVVCLFGAIMLLWLWEVGRTEDDALHRPLDLEVFAFVSAVTVGDFAAAEDAVRKAVALSENLPAQNDIPS